MKFTARTVVAYTPASSAKSTSFVECSSFVEFSSFVKFLFLFLKIKQFSFKLRVTPSLVASLQTN